MKPKEFKQDLALIGIGHWGKNLARNFDDLGALHTICDIQPKNLNQYKLIYPHINFTLSYQEILENKNIKKIVIAAPTEMHFNLAKQALMLGKDVFIEKAMSSDAKQASELHELSKKQHSILMVGHILHYHPCVKRIKEMIRGGDLGELLHLNFNRLNFGSRGPEKSSLWAFAPHDISLLLSLCANQQLLSLECVQDSFYSERFSDQSWLALNFSDNIRANIHVNWINPVPERKLTIVGTKGAIIFDDLQGWNDKLTFWETSVQLKQGVLQFNQKSGEKIIIETKEPLHTECEHFLQSCLERRTPITDSLEGVNVMKVLDLAQQSAQSMQNLELDTYNSMELQR
ncbi:MAG: Inositol 2-dehydrogenase/D-chiro-inositol 3-dehydrogenase [Chlamydiae bacterium]|nr:Inositol 2-dehydrogenase/D-chiro-inositol 3-dehydrogenase [Chlamydiota bacterium]